MDFVKIWVDDRNGKYKKLTPELYGAVIDEAHKHKLRVTVHVFYLEDAKGLFRAGIDAFAHGVRDLDVDDELMAMVKKRPDFVLVPNMPDRGVATDMSWLKDSVSADQLKKLQAGATDREAQKAFGIRRATWRSSTPRAPRSRSARMATLPGASTSRWKTWWPQG